MEEARIRRRNAKVRDGKEEYYYCAVERKKEREEERIYKVDVVLRG